MTKASPNLGSQIEIEGAGDFAAADPISHRRHWPETHSGGEGSTVLYCTVAVRAVLSCTVAVRAVLYCTVAVRGTSTIEVWANTGPSCKGGQKSS